MNIHKMKHNTVQKDEKKGNSILGLRCDKALRVRTDVLGVPLGRVSSTMICARHVRRIHRVPHMDVSREALRLAVTGPRVHERVIVHRIPQRLLALAAVESVLPVSYRRQCLIVTPAAECLNIDMSSTNTERHWAILFTEAWLLLKLIHATASASDHAPAPFVDPVCGP